MKSKSLQAVTAKASTGPSGKPFFQKKGETEAGRAFFEKQGLSVGKPDSIYEKEADGMAEQVVSRSSQNTATPLYSKVTPLVQRQENSEEEELQAKVQRQENNEEEELQAKIQRQENSEEEELQEKVQRQEATEPVFAKATGDREEEIQAKVQRRSSSSGLSTEPDLSRRLRSAKGQGSKLEGPVQARMEKGFGADFSEVRVHTDSRAEEMSQSLNAQAFTVGKDVFFNKNKFRPDTPDGEGLLAHELTHTIQQGAVSPKKEATAPAPESETPDTSPETVETETDENVPPETAEAPASPESGEGGEATTEEGQKAEEEPPYPRSPEENPAFQQTQENLDKKARKQKSHQPAEQASAGAQSAAPSPDNERLSIAQAGQVEEMNQGAESKGKFDAEKFKSLLLEQIERILPKNEEEADDFAESNEMDTVKSAASSQAAVEKENAAGSIEQATEKEPDESSVPERETHPLQPEQPGPQPGSIGASGAMPPPRRASEVSQPLQENMEEVDDVFAEEEVTDEQLARSNEPDFLAARDAHHEAQAHTQTAPGEFRRQEGETLSGAREAAQSESAGQLEGMHNEREGLLGEVEARQQQTMSEDNAERAQVARDINAIFERTKTEVEGILENLDAEVETGFDTGEADARERFEGYVDRKMEAYKDERYGGITGFARRVGDVFTGLPDEVNAFFMEGRDLYIRIMDGVLTDISQNVADKLNEAQLRITEGRQEVADYVAALPENLQSVGQEAAEDIQSKFDSLESDVESKQDELITSLSNRYKESLEAVDARIEEMKAANQGLIDMAIGFAKKVIEVIREIKNVILGLISAAVAAVKAIIADPIGFLGSLISGLSQGINNFFSNIWDHLLGGLFQWLTGALGPLSINIPENLFSLQGAFDLVRQVLGLTYDFVREQAVKIFGEDVVRVIETGLEILVIFAKGGLMVVWEYIKDKLTDLKQTVIDAIMNMVITEVFKAGTKWLLGLLNPVSAFVKAAMAIIDIVKFFIQRGRQILALVEAFTQAILEIASGNVAKVAAAIENALARALPVVIGFLASLLGISGLVGKVQKLVQKVRERIANAIRSVFEKIKSVAFKLFSKLTGKGKKGEEDLEGADEAKTGQGEKLGDTEVGETVKFTAEGESHKLWINTAGSGVEVMVASTPMTVGEKLDQWEGRLNELDDDSRKEAGPLITQARTQYKKTRDSGTMAEREMDEATASTDVQEMQQAETADERVESDEAVLKGQLKRLFGLFGEEEEFTAHVLAKVDPQAETAIKAIFNKESDKVKGKDEKGLIAFLEGHAEVQKIQSRPLARNEHDFGKAAFNNQALPKLKSVMAAEEKTQSNLEPAKTEKEWVSNRVGVIHGEQTHTAGEARKQLGKQVLDKNNRANADKALGDYFIFSLNTEQEHTAFEPTDIKTFPDTPQKGKTTITYSYEGGSERFTVVYDSSSGLTENISAENLSFNSLGRGKLEGSAKKGLDRSHLIADFIKGSGYRKSKNIIYASDNFNRITMRDAELALAKGINRYEEASSFDLAIEVEWAIDEGVPISNVRTAINQRLLSLAGKSGKQIDTEKQVLNNLSKLSDGALKKEVEANIASIGQPRVRDVIYEVLAIKMKDGSVEQPFLTENTGPDLFFGTQKP